MNQAKVQWGEEVVDNEFMGKKKSKSQSCFRLRTGADGRRSDGGS